MPWPWRAARSNSRVVLQLGRQQLAYLQAPLGGHAPLAPERWGLIELGEPADDALQRQLAELGLAGGEVLALLDADAYQILKIDTPNVPQDELKAAARWQIKDLLEVALDELTLDVMHVGDDQPRAHKQLFVVAGSNRAIERVSRLGAAAGLPLDVVDIGETALRNLQSAAAAAEDLTKRATAALLLQGGQCLFTICAHGELFYTRRLDWDARLLKRATQTSAPKADAPAPLGYEYMPGDDLAFSGLDAELESSPLVLELQRSIDVWERSWPDLPLARLYLVVPEHGQELAALLQRELGLRTSAIDASSLFPGFEPAAHGPEAYAACLPLLGALLRQDERAL
jgi:MSHA biogenesis protein MshI